MLNSLGISPTLLVILVSTQFLFPAESAENSSLNKLYKIRVESFPKKCSLLDRADSLNDYQKHLQAGKCVNSDNPEVKQQEKNR